jgi:hypothetical protein
MASLKTKGNKPRERELTKDNENTAIKRASDTFAAVYTPKKLLGSSCFMKALYKQSQLFWKKQLQH